MELTSEIILRMILLSWLILPTTPCVTDTDCTSGMCYAYEDQKSYCSCRSGYFGSTCTESVASCNVSFVDESIGKISPINVTAVCDVEDIVYLWISFPLVRNRWSTQIVLGDYLLSKDNWNCAYPGPLWNKTITNCTETYSTVIPWSTAFYECGCFTSYPNILSVQIVSYDIVASSPIAKMVMLSIDVVVLSVSNATNANETISSTGDGSTDNSKSLVGTIVLIILGLCLLASCLYNAHILDPLVRHLPDDVMAANRWLLKGRKYHGTIISKQRQGNNIIVIWEKEQNSDYSEISCSDSDEEREENPSSGPPPPSEVQVGDGGVNTGVDTRVYDDNHDEAS